jgi:hypothetical protein
MTTKIKASNIDSGAVTADKLHTTAVTDKLGYTPVTPTELSTAVSNAASDATSKANAAQAAAQSYADSSVANVPVPTLSSLGLDNHDQLTVDASGNTTFGSGNIKFGPDQVILPGGTTEERPESPALGSIRYNSTLGIVEIYDTNGWSGIASPPSVSSVSPTSFNGENGTSITVSGSSFDVNASVVFVTSSNVEYSASSTTRNSANELVASTPRDFTVAEGPLTIKVVNGTGLSGVLSGALDAGSVPAWNTGAGSLATVYDSSRSGFSTTVSASDPDTGSTITYSLVSGSLPSGASLNSSNGTISGNINSVGSDTTYSFTLRATDNAGNTTDRAFSITVRKPVTTTLTSGSGNFTVPSGVTKLIVKMWGGGGSSGRVGGLHCGGGAGGAGAYFDCAVSSGSSYAYSVGAAGPNSGTSNSNGDGNDGGPSSFLGVSCGGGYRGLSSAGGNNRTSPGGTVSGSPQSSYSFFVTESGQSNNNGIGGGVIQNAAGGTNWSGTITAFGGGAGVPQGNSGCTPGNSPGGGAGGSYGSNHDSRDGGRGEIQISY